MKNLFALTSIFSVLVFFTPNASNATTLAITNIVNTADITQINDCETCTAVEQINISVIFQTIMLPPSWFMTNSVQLLADTLNNADIVQDNFCESCVGVTQDNQAIVQQEIRLPNQIISEEVLDPGSIPIEFILNEVLNVEVNYCDSCIDSTQVNATRVDQYFTFTDPLLLSAESIILNTANIFQINYCINCTNLEQINIAIVYQSIQALPTPTTLFLVGSGLGLMGWRAQKKNL